MKIETPSSLPDSPGALLAAAEGFSSSMDDSGMPDSGGQGATTSTNSTNSTNSTKKRMVLPRIKLVGSSQQAPPQRARDKIELGLRESVTPYAMLGWPLSAGWSHLINGSPNYGVNSEAFAQRLGAAAALNSSKEIFSDGILATAFHQDPRYYQRGRSHKLINRAVYAVTRPVIGRTDSGRTIPNYAFILGTGGAAALTQTYYPERNVTGTQFARTWITSLGGSAFGSLVSEFGGEAIQWLRISKGE
ncbi:hypothetical protein [Edaphobacter modestus]|uniref:hypothetical protein n=1 Tax=Edaphobacter modestus TaxID=388466 RepID=UPI00102AAB1A|nr:hypothetical protein [Edaphobacter modestus]